MTTLENFWLPAVNLFLQSTVVLGAGCLIAWLLRHRAVAQRVLVLRATLCATALSAILCVALSGRVQPLWNLQSPAPIVASAPLREAPPITPPLPANETRAKAPLGTSPPALTPPPEIAATAEKATPLRLESCLVFLWLSGAATLTLWTLACHFHLWRLRRNAIAVNDESAVALLNQLAREVKISPPQLRHSAQVKGPLLCGLWRPVLLWPATDDFEFDFSARRAIFVHELTHLQRRDLWWSALSHLVCGLLWPQVLAWVVARQLEASSEEYCDAVVIEAGCAPREYAACLLDWAERLALPLRER